MLLEILRKRESIKLDYHAFAKDLANNQFKKFNYMIFIMIKIIIIIVIKSKR